MKKYLLWLYPGLKIKRYILLIIAGILSFAWGFHLLIVENLRLYLLIVLCISIFLIAYGFKKLLNSVLKSLYPDERGNVIEELYLRKKLLRGPKIAVIGGGTGLATLLRGLKHYTSNITAIVTVADDGGSSGRLREEMGMLPPGDLRNCLVALADKESLMESLLQFRFTEGDLAGHSMGNLLLAALWKINGNFSQAVFSLGQILKVRGVVYPSTEDKVVLRGILVNGDEVVGESRFREVAVPIKRVYLHPPGAKTLPEVEKALLEADLIILGPGSLFTSIIPNLLVKGVVESIRKSRAPVLYVMNIMTEKGETAGFAAHDHLQAIIEHAGPIVDYVLVNNESFAEQLLAKYQREGQQPVAVNEKLLKKLGVKKVIKAPLLDQKQYLRHDSEKLARVIINFYRKEIAEKI
ncbi:gluconeogenesis factor YvcK family protein [Carboxydothermus ferrireducens]|uniref:Putative gluconeogenesis factor n=1 Tax=Carboxydothermus ferrireducens DSM 11255 TaxID=1119529 RepID=A0ABX2RBZ7_9THEO|nr:gluconeogenesis factor YvcK family protein [Carboxydothermus ferrireducens]NYE57323.1 putative cofD-like protein [Carboxydothermus ferrireducens DSM 11255]